MGVVICMHYACLSNRSRAYDAVLIKRVNYLMEPICTNLLTVSASIRNDTKLALI